MFGDIGEVESKTLILHSIFLGTKRITVWLRLTQLMIEHTNQRFDGS